MTCECGYEHSNTADRLACAAIRGRVSHWASDARGGRDDALCMLCGAVEPFASLLDHFRLVHGGGDPGTGHLVRHIIDTRDVSDAP